MRRKRKPIKCHFCGKHRGNNPDPIGEFRFVIQDGTITTHGHYKPYINRKGVTIRPGIWHIVRRAIWICKTDGCEDK